MSGEKIGVVFGELYKGKDGWQKTVFGIYLDDQQARWRFEEVRRWDTARDVTLEFRRPDVAYEPCPLCGSTAGFEEDLMGDGWERCRGCGTN